MGMSRNSKDQTLRTGSNQSQGAVTYGDPLLCTATPTSCSIHTPTDFSRCLRQCGFRFLIQQDPEPGETRRVKCAMERWPSFSSHRRIGEWKKIIGWIDGWWQPKCQQVMQLWDSSQMTSDCSSGTFDCLTQTILIIHDSQASSSISAKSSKHHLKSTSDLTPPHPCRSVCNITQAPSSLWQWLFSSLLYCILLMSSLSDLSQLPEAS